MTGTVIRTAGSWQLVRTDEGQLLSCKVKGTFRIRGLRSTNPVAVGDRVTIAPEQCLITDILERRNYIVRRASNLSKQCHIIAANVDQALLIVTLAHPATSTTFIDRFLASAEAYRIPVVIAFNKTDLLDSDGLSALASLRNLYEGIGYETHAVCALSAQLSTLVASLADKTTLLSGHSGVGKSTLLNALAPEAGARTAEISVAHDTGMHTTTLSQMFALPQGGALIDTPGIKGFGVFDMRPEEVPHYFRDIFAVGKECRFGDCTHTHEPGCAVRTALAQGRIAQSRYDSYLNIITPDDKYRGLGY